MANTNNYRDFRGLTKIAHAKSYLQKQAVVAETSWGQEHPILSAAADIGLYSIPGVGSVLSGRDAINAFRNGQWATGLGELGFAALGLFGAGGVAKGVGKGLLRGAKALKHTSKVVPKARVAANTMTRGAAKANNIANKYYTNTRLGRIDRLSNLDKSEIGRVAAGKPISAFNIPKGMTPIQAAKKAKLYKGLRRTVGGGSLSLYLGDQVYDALNYALDGYQDTGNYDPNAGNYDQDTGNYDPNAGNYDQNAGNYDQLVLDVINNYRESHKPKPPKYGPKLYQIPKAPMLIYR